MSEIGCLRDIHVNNLEVEQHSLINGHQTVSGNQRITGHSSLTGNLNFLTGGAVEQANNKQTSVSLNGRSGKITTNNAELAANGIVSFTVSNTSITASDVILANHVSGGTLGSYVININTIADGSFNATITNITSGALSESLVIHFVAFTATVS